ncbi:hypothetical protein [Enterovirga aerilata]|uniref:Mu-like prophage FluMu N-terminal domain-containing protein n=1 Tax=Enterovirga aerilata TaxID=2730920 RepID=A0A849IAX4_9HYPH|nr:hypothetical protein [Enterovirga sp. DB1703]NNM75054.1 hypothetical protein [Enterovirga sp. DB1703]
MKMFRFTQAFDFKPSPGVTMHYAAGSVRKLPEAQVEAALAAGAGQIDESATEEMIVDDTPGPAPVIRQEPRPVYVAPKVREAAVEKAGKGK